MFFSVVIPVYNKEKDTSQYIGNSTGAVLY